MSTGPGSVSDAFDTVSLCRYMELSYNNLSSSIPSTLGSLTALR